jgi:AcrR family transcriptional regulator
MVVKPMAPTTKTRMRMSGSERREQLLDVTKAMVGEEGFHAVSIEAVARAAGISRPIVYSHFDDLGGLLEAMVERETERALGQLAAILPAGVGVGDPREDLLAALRGYLEAVSGDPVTWRLVLIPPEGAPELLRDRINRGRDAVVAVLADVVRPGLAPGRETPDPQLTARLLSALADEAARLMLTRPEQYPIERLMDHARWLLGELSAPKPPAGT